MATSVLEINPWDHYYNLGPLGRGARATVYKVSELATGNLYALKLLPRGDGIDEQVWRELLNHRRLPPHPNVIGFKKVFLSRHHLGVVMEYASGGALFRRVRRARWLHEALARFYFQQLISGLCHLHNEGVCHRDIKLENTLVHEVVHEENSMPIVKICDFGFSKHAEADSRPHSRVGTPSYVAPEVIVMRSGYHGQLADMWSAGVMLYVMLFGKYPFSDPRDPNHHFGLTVDRIVRGDYDVPANIPVSAACKDLLARLLKVRPEERATVADVQAHPWYLEQLPSEIRDNYPEV